MSEATRTMQARDVISAKLATAYVTVNGKRYLLFQAQKFEATIEKEKEQVAILGRMLKGNKSAGTKGSGSMTIYHNTDLFTDMMMKYVTTGEDTYFDIQVTNEDPTSRAGRHTVILKDCNIDKVTISSFDADGKWLESETNFTFEDVKMPERFKMLDGMQA